MEGPEAPAAGSHVPNTGIQLLLAEAWLAYLDVITGGRENTVKLVPTVRELFISFEREIFPGDRLTCGIRPTGRGRTSFTLAQELRHGEDGPIATTGHIVIVSVDRATHRPKALSDSLWARMAAYERGETANE
jgi:acyl-CoA thioesterase FadM